MKRFLSCIDSGFIKYVPQPIQHLVIADKAHKLGGKVIFSVGEEEGTLSSQAAIRARIQDTSTKVDGVIFFALRQFLYGKRFNFELLEFLLNRDNEVHFARENFSYQDIEALNRNFPILYATEYVYKRDESQDFRQSVWHWLNEEPNQGAVID